MDDGMWISGCEYAMRGLDEEGLDEGVFWRYRWRTRVGVTWMMSAEGRGYESAIWLGGARHDDCEGVCGRR